MQIQVNTDRTIKGDEDLTQQVRSEIEARLGRFGDRITRIEVHLGDENSHKSRGDDKRCLIEVRPAGLKPVVATHRAPSVAQALEGAADKVERLLDGSLERLFDPKGRTPYGGDPEA